MVGALGEALLRLQRREQGVRQHCGQVVVVARELHLHPVQRCHRRRQLGSHFENRLQDLEHHQEDLELIHIHKIRDERDDRVEAVESEVKELASWRLLVDGSIDYLCMEVKRLSKH